LFHYFYVSLSTGDNETGRQTRPKFNSEPLPNMPFFQQELPDKLRFLPNWKLYLSESIVLIKNLSKVL
jgi:hypothetical protein